jgi:spore germination protein
MLEAERKETAPTGYRVKYLIKPGDTLKAISEKFGITMDSISAANKLEATSNLSLGQEIEVPIPEDHLYALKPKETLWRLAKRYGLTVEQLMEINNLASSTNLEIGQNIILPIPISQIVDNRF